jgi:hypothetical protein
MVDVLLKAAPFYVRAERERQQADDAYKAGVSLTVRSKLHPDVTKFQ